jgi:hypothetical protein
MKGKSVVVFLFLLVLTGCAASVDVKKTYKGFYDKTDPNEVEILKTRPEKSYVELGTVTVTNFDPEQTAKMHNAIRAKSSALGATEVILTDEGMVREPWHGLRRWVTGVAVRYE